MKVAIIEYSGVEGYNMPIRMPVLDRDKYNSFGERPGYHIQEVVKEFERYCHPSIELFILPYTHAGLRWCLANGVSLVSMSAMDWRYLSTIDIEKYEKPLMDAGVTLVCGAGNDGRKEDHKESPASLRGWLSVGAIDRNLNPEYYTSWGKGEVDTCAIVNLHGFKGTSDACPIVAGLITHYYENHKEALGYYPSRLQVHEWVKLNSHDVWDEGWDYKTGYGILKLPRRWEFKDVIYQLDDPSTMKLESMKKIERTWKAGKMESISKDCYRPFDVIDGRSAVNPRGVADSLNLTTHWDPVTKKAYFSTVQ